MTPRGDVAAANRRHARGNHNPRLVSRDLAVFSGLPYERCWAQERDALDFPSWIPAVLRLDLISESKIYFLF